MDSSTRYDTINLGWFIVHIEGSQVIISNKIVLFSLKIILVLVNSVDPDERLHYAAFHLGLYCLPRYPLWGFQIKPH